MKNKLVSIGLILFIIFNLIFWYYVSVVSIKIGEQVTPSQPKWREYSCPTFQVRVGNHCQRTGEWGE